MTIPVISIELYLIATRFGIIDQGHMIKEISRSQFEEQSEDYIVLKTDHWAGKASCSRSVKLPHQGGQCSQ